MVSWFWTRILLCLTGIVFVVCGWLFCRGKNVQLLGQFKRQTTAGRIFLAILLLSAWIFASIKPGDGTNSPPQMASPPVSGPLQPMTFPGIATNTLHGGLRGGIVPTGGILGDGSPVIDEWSGFVPIASTNTTRVLDGDDFRRGFVMTQTGTDGSFDFSPPSNAVVCADWRVLGAATAWTYANVEWEPENERWPEGNVRLRIHSDGWVEVKDGSVFYPLRTVLGVVPEVNWNQLAEPDRPSQMWYCVSPRNTLVVTWQNALYERDTDKPVSFQAEFHADGRFDFRYDFSRLTNETGVAAITGAKSGMGQWTTNALPTNLTSMTFRPLSANDATNHDPDGDGIPTIDELFVCHTDPHCADTDHDGLSDSDELFLYGTDPLDPYSLNGSCCDGYALKIGDLDPFSYPEGSTNTVLEHVFYSGTTNGAFAYPQPTDGMAVLKVMVSGFGTGRLVVGDSVVPLVARPPMRSGVVTNTLLLGVGKGARKKVEWDKPDGMAVAMDSGDFFIGVLPAQSRQCGWLAFPHTDATIPCVHDFCGNGKTVTLVHGEEFPGLTATWASEDSDVEIENEPPVSAAIHGSFLRDGTRSISYTLDHPYVLNSEIPSYGQTLRFCPQHPGVEEPSGNGGTGGGSDGFSQNYYCECSAAVPCAACSGDWCHCQSQQCQCNANRSPLLDEDDAEAEEAFTNIVEGAGMTQLEDVLYLYRDNVQTASLEVPGGEPRRCCPCPEHWASNYVAKVAYTDRVAVGDAAGNDFEIAYEPCTVSMSGVSPSRGFADSTILFVTNGAPYMQRDFTVLGLKIARPEWTVPLERYNQLSPSFGYPVEICTNLEDACSLILRTDVLLDGGVIRLAFENADGGFQLWLPGWTDNHGLNHAPELLLDSVSMPERHIPVEKWRNVMRRYFDTRNLEVKVLSSATGGCNLKFEYAANRGTQYVHDFASQKISSVNPVLLADYDRDGTIGVWDVSWRLRKRSFRYWINECRITGDVWNEPSLFEGIADALFSSENWRNDHVDGRFDLINLFPVAIRAEPFVNAWSGSGDVKIKIRCLDGDDRLRFTFVNVAHSAAGTIRTAPVQNISGEPLYCATMNWLTNSVNLSATEYTGDFDGGSALMVCEAAGTTWLGLALSMEVDGVNMFSARLPMRMGAIDDMYRYASIRGAHDSPNMELAIPSVPPNNPEAEAYAKDVFFVHGFNVSPENAREWNREMFKRFWVSGMKARYWGVTWEGDSLWPNGLYYHRDVRQALLTAPTFARLVNTCGTNSVVIGHSLGNMVVSEALLKGANASTYIMLDAAVASEAYRPDLQADSTEIVDKYVPSDWDGYHERTWAANWYTWFTNDVTDARGKIGWAGHFAPLLDRQGLSVYNFYSSGDEVFNESTNGTPGLVTGVFHWPTLNLDWPFFHLNWELDAYPWQKQEVFKGVNAAGSFSAGWGFHCWATNTGNGVTWVKYSAAGANAMVADGSIVTNAVFDRGVSAMFSPTISDYDKADILAYHIPAVSSPAGKVETIGGVSGVTRDYNLNENIYRANGWGRMGVDVEDEHGQIITVFPWLHSDIKNMAYYYIYPAITNIVEKGCMK